MNQSRASRPSTAPCTSTPISSQLENGLELAVALTLTSTRPCARLNRFQIAGRRHRTRNHQMIGQILSSRLS